MSFEKYKSDYEMFSPVMQGVIKSVVRHAIDIINDMNGDANSFVDHYNYIDIYENARQLLSMEIDPGQSGVFNVSVMLENAIRYVIMRNVEYSFKD